MPDPRDVDIPRQGDGGGKHAGGNGDLDPSKDPDYDSKHK